MMPSRKGGPSGLYNEMGGVMGLGVHSGRRILGTLCGKCRDANTSVKFSDDTLSCNWDFKHKIARHTPCCRRNRAFGEAES